MKEHYYEDLGLQNKMKIENFYLIIDTKTGLIIDGNSFAIDFFFGKSRQWENASIKNLFKDLNFIEKLLSFLREEANHIFIESPVSIVSFDGTETPISLKAKIYSDFSRRTARLSFSNIISKKAGINTISELNSEGMLNSLKYAVDKAAIVFITDSNGIVKYVNDNFCSLSMYSKEDLVGNTPQILNSGYHSKSFFSNLWNTIKSGNTWRGEIQNRKKNGDMYWVDTVIVPILDENDEIYQYFSIRYDITSKKDKEILIQKALKEKELLINEIHNRVKNNLQIICSLINLKRDSFKDLRLNETLGELHGKVISMSLAYDEVYRSDNFTEIDFKSYIERLDHFLSRNYLTTKIDFNITGESIFLKLEEAINFGIIICEIISNYMKHAFNPRINPRINILFIKKKSLFLMKISDNGPGFPEPVIMEGNMGMGLQLIEGLALQMKGRLELYNENGAVYDIEVIT